MEVVGSRGGRRFLGLLVGVPWSGCCAPCKLEGTEVDTKCQSVGVLERGLSGVTGGAAAVAMGVGRLTTGSSTPVMMITGLGMRSFGSTNVCGSSWGRPVLGLLMVVLPVCCSLFGLGGVGVDPSCQWTGGLDWWGWGVSWVAGATSAAVGLRVGGLAGESSILIVGIKGSGARSPPTKRDCVSLRR